jgi:hypothetical protein
MQHYGFHESDTYEHELYFYTLVKKKQQFYVTKGLQCVSLQIHLNMHPKNWINNQKLIQKLIFVMREQ